MAWANATFDNVLDDLSSRFIINVPDEELASVERICFQIEQAHWFYEDFVREQNPALPSFNLKNFSAKFFQHCPLLHEWSNEHETAFANFMEYKIRVPVCGAIILNEAMDKCILVKGWTARSGWGFPKGKINKDEPDASCAVREVWEETGFDCTDRIKDEDFVEQTIKDQRIRLYIIKGVPESTVFEPQTRKEISKIEWHYLAELPTSKPKPIEKGTQSGKESGTERAMGAKNPSRYYMVTPFVHKLKNWISAQRRNSKRNNHGNNHGNNNSNSRGQYVQAPQPQQQHHTHPAENNAAAAAPRHQQHNHHHAHQTTAVPVVSATDARLDSEMLKNMLRIGKQESPSAQHKQQPRINPGQDASPTLKDTRNSSDSLKALLGIQSPGTAHMFIHGEGGFTTGSPTIHSASPAYQHSTRPVSTPSLPTSSSASSASYQNGSDALKAMLGISAQSHGGSASSPLLHFNHVVNGTSPVVSHNNSGATVPNGHHGQYQQHQQQQQQQRPDFSPQIHHSSPAVAAATATNSPMGSRNGAVDLLALLKGGGGGGDTGSPNGHHTQNQNPGFGQGFDANSNNIHMNGDSNISTNINRNSAPGNNGAPAKAKGMQNFAFDVDALF